MRGVSDLLALVDLALDGDRFVVHDGGLDLAGLLHGEIDGLRYIISVRRALFGERVLAGREGIDHMVLRGGSPRIDDLAIGILERELRAFDFGLIRDIALGDMELGVVVRDIDRVLDHALGHAVGIDCEGENVRVLDVAGWSLGLDHAVGTGGEVLHVELTLYICGALGELLAVFEEDGLALDRVIGDGCVGDLAALDGNLSHRDTIDGDGVFAGGKGLVGGVCHAGGIPRQFHARHRVTGLAEFCGSSEDMILDGDGIGLTLVYGNRGVGKLHLIVALLSHDGVVNSLDSRVASDLDLLAVLVLQDNRIFIRIDRDGGRGDILLDGDLFALIGADCDGSSGLEGLLVIDVPNVELGAGEDIIGTENGLVDLYLGRLVLLLYGSGHEIGLVVLIGKGELDRGRIEHMALRSLGLDEGIGCGTGTEIKFLGGGGSIVTGDHMVDDLSLGRTHGAIGGDDILLRDDIVLCIFEILAVIGAGLGDGRLPHDLPVEDLYDGDGRGVFVVLGDLETDRLAVEQIRGGGGDFLDGVLAGLQLSGHGDLTVRVGGERVNLGVHVIRVVKRYDLAVSIEDLELEAGEQNRVARLRVAFNDLESARQRLVDHGVVLRALVDLFICRDSPVIDMVVTLGHRGIHLVDRVALLIDRQRAVDAGITLALAEPRTGCIIRLVLGDGGLVTGIGILGGGESALVGGQRADDLAGGVRNDLELHADGGLAMAVVGLPAVVLAAFGLGDLDIERLRVLGEIVFRLKLKNAGVGALIGINRIGMHSCIKLITGGCLDFYDLNITKRNAIKVQNALGICLSGRFPARS